MSNSRCPRCKKLIVDSCNYCSKKRSDRLQRTRNVVITHYGGECVWCKESRARNLAIDHIDGTGASTRGLGAYQRLRKIIIANFPDNLRILCHNCNSGRAIYGDENVTRAIAGLIPIGLSKRNQADKLAVLDHYGKECAICGQNAFVFLTVDHVGGGGRKHRAEIGNSINRWLIKNDFPDGYRTLCWNCNCSSTARGENIIHEDSTLSGACRGNS